jgi:hypothetical protein
MTLDPTPPPLGSAGDELYRALGGHAGRGVAYDDENQGWVLAHLCEAAGRMWQAVRDLVYTDEAGNPGWSALFDLDRCPGQDDEIDGLPFLGQLGGVRGLLALPDDERRTAIREREGYHRCRPSAIVSYAMRFTDGTPGAVTLRERYNPALGAGVDAPGYGQVRIKRSRLLPGLDEAEITARILERLPMGRIYEVVITDEADFEQLRQDFDDFRDVADSFTDFGDLADYRP